ncbi:MAG: hypothetical protein DYH06_05335, partial [Acidobacteria bacterium ACB2]|nr:hypothetical protein [Acidobacteria bacterium ACB2]
AIRQVIVTQSDVNLIIEVQSQGEEQELAVNDILADIDEGDVEVVENDQEDVDFAKQAGESPVIRYVNYIAGRDGWSHYGTPNDGGAYGMGLHSMTSAWTTGLATFGEWKLSSAGPDQNANLNFVTEELIYDATNGTISQGDIVRSQLEPEARP